MKNIILSILAGIVAFIPTYFALAFITLDLWWVAEATENATAMRFFLILVSSAVTAWCILEKPFKEGTL